MKTLKSYRVGLFLLPLMFALASAGTEAEADKHEHADRPAWRQMPARSL